MEKVLLVAGESEQTGVWRQALERSGFSVLHAADEEQVLEALSTSGLDLILIDIAIIYQVPHVKSVLRLHGYMIPQLLVDQTGVHTHWCPRYRDPGFRGFTCGGLDAPEKRELENRISRVLQTEDPALQGEVRPAEA